MLPLLHLRELFSVHDTVNEYNTMFATVERTEPMSEYLAFRRNYVHHSPSVYFYSTYYCFEQTLGST